jgi:hypothetical protein
VKIEIEVVCASEVPLDAALLIVPLNYLDRLKTAGMDSEALTEWMLENPKAVMLTNLVAYRP